VLEVVSPPVLDRREALWPSRNRVQAGVGCDPVEPPVNGTSTVETRQSPPGMKERVLKRVLGVVTRAEHAVAVCEQPTSVRFDEVPKRLLVAVMGRLDELALGPRHVLELGTHRMAEIPACKSGYTILLRLES